MCGIVGVVRFDGRSVSEAEIRGLNAKITHRGPDDEGAYVQDGVGLAMRRLSIIDLDAGHQPMWSADRRYVIVFNGEIYNYKEVRTTLSALGHTFATHSDTEVVLAGYQVWGPAILDRLLGMWGLAIYDTVKRELFLARDRLGKKQIYYGLTARYFVFGSEMSVPMSYATDLRRLDRSVVAEYLRHGYVGGDVSPVQGVSLLPAAHWAMVDADGRLTMREYWNIHDAPHEALPRDERELAETVYLLIVDAVRYRLVADVPISVMLSSGLDSSALAYVLAKELRVPLQTFTLGFDDAAFDESQDAGAFADALGLPWHREFVSGRDVARDFPSMIAHMSSLQSNTAQIVYYYVARMIRSAGYKVALNGNGGDELFAGYPTYRATRLFGLYRRVPSLVRRGVHQLAQKVPTTFGRVSFDYKLKKFTEISDMRAISAHGYWRTMFGPTELRALMRRDAFATLSNHTDLYDRTTSRFDVAEAPTITNLLKADMLAWLQPMLPWTDNMSMAHSVELRLPMLDHRLVSLVYSLPDEAIFRGWNLKRLLKTMLTGRLPSNVLFRRKRGTHLPVSKWINGDLAPIVDAHLSSDSMRALGLFEETKVRQLLARHRSGAQDNTFKLWNLTVFAAWVAEHGISIA